MQSHFPPPLPPPAADLLAWLRSEEAHALAAEDHPRARAKARRAGRRERALAHQRAALSWRVWEDRTGLDRIVARRCGQPWAETLPTLRRIMPAPRWLRASRRYIGDYLVHTDAALVDGKPHARSGHPLRSGFYVCPEDGLLKDIANGRSTYQKRRRHRTPRPVSAGIDRQARWLRGGDHGEGWYLVTLSPLPPREEWGQARDVVLGQTLAALHRAAYLRNALNAALLHEDRYASAARWMSARELAELGIKSRRQPRGPYDRACQRRPPQPPRRL